MAIIKLATAMDMHHLTMQYPYSLDFLQYFVVDNHQQHKHHQVVGAYHHTVARSKYTHVVDIVGRRLQKYKHFFIESKEGNAQLYILHFNFVSIVTGTNLRKTFTLIGTCYYRNKGAP